MITPPRLRILLWIIVFVLAVGIGVRLAQHHFPATPAPVPTLYTGAAGQRPVGGPFSLQSTLGTTVTEHNLKGHYSLIYFGYTFCPDICPMALTNITAALSQLAPAVRAKIEPYFITVDPQRDTLQRLKDFLTPFSPPWQGLTGSKDAVEHAIKGFAVYAAKVDDDHKNTPYYLMDHSSIVYIMGPDGTYVGHFTHATPPDEIVAHLNRLIRP